MYLSRENDKIKKKKTQTEKFYSEPTPVRALLMQRKTS
jgi:hypothetical protein